MHSQKGQALSARREADSKINPPLVYLDFRGDSRGTLRDKHIPTQGIVALAVSIGYATVLALCSPKHYSISATFRMLLEPAI